MTTAKHEEPVAEEPGATSRRRWFLSISGLLLVTILWAFRDVLVPFLLALILAYVFSPVVKAGERMTVAGRTPPRWAVVLTLYAVLISSLTIGSVVAVPRLSAEFSKLASDAPRLVAKVRAEVLPEIERRLSTATAAYRSELRASEEDDVPERGEDGGVLRRHPPNVVRVQPTEDGAFEVVLPSQGLRVLPSGDDGAFVIAPADPPRVESAPDITEAVLASLTRAMHTTEKGTVSLIQTAQKVVAALARGVFGFVMMLMLSAYMLVTSDRIFQFFRNLYPLGKRHNFDELVARIDRGLAGVVRGQLTISLVNGVLSGIGFYILGLKYWVFLTLVATAFSVIPIFGSILSTVPAVMVALPESMGLAFLVLAWVVGIHQIEANLLNPKIMGDAARVHPVLVVFALLAGEHVAGITGALFAVPFLSITQTLFLYLRERYLGVPRASLPPPPPPSTPAESAGPTEAAAPAATTE